MQVEAINVTGTILQQQPRASDNINNARKDQAKGQQESADSNASAQNKVQPEEILNQIKSLTEDGLYSVRFENNKEYNELVVKIVNTKTDEVIRQVPAEEILGLKMSLEELRGAFVDTVR